MTVHPVEAASPAPTRGRPPNRAGTGLAVVGWLEANEGWHTAMHIASALGWSGPQRIGSACITKWAPIGRKYIDGVPHYRHDPRMSGVWPAVAGPRSTSTVASKVARWLKSNPGWHTDGAIVSGARLPRPGIVSNVYRLKWPPIARKARGDGHARKYVYRYDRTMSGRRPTDVSPTKPPRTLPSEPEPTTTGSAPSFGTTTYDDAILMLEDAASILGAVGASGACLVKAIAILKHRRGDV